MRIAILVLDGVFDTGLSVVLDTLETANALAERGRTPFDVRVVGLRRAVRTHHGHRVDLAPVSDAPAPDVVVVPALGAKTIDAISASLERPDVLETRDLFAAWSRGRTRVAGACTATFVLASAGILDGGSATTTWWLAPVFRERFPRVSLDESRMIVESDRVITAGAALAHVDLALWLVRQSSPTLARATARHLVFDARPSQGAYTMPDHLAHSDPTVEKFEKWARRHLADFDLASAARAAGVSERTLERKVRAVLRRSPLGYVRDLRVEQALHELSTTRGTVDEIAERVGYKDAVTLRTLLKKKTGRGVKELRALG